MYGVFAYYILAFALFSGNVTVITEPAECDIYLDETFVGVSAQNHVLLLRDVPAEQHSVRVEKKGFKKQTKTFQVENSDLFIRFSLVPVLSKPRHFLLKTNPGEAKVYFNNKFIGTSDSNGIIKLLISKEHKGIIRAEKAGFAVSVMEVNLDDFTNSTININLVHLNTSKNNLNTNKNNLNTNKNNNPEHNKFFFDEWRNIVLVTLIILTLLLLLLLVKDKNYRNRQKKSAKSTKLVNTDNIFNDTNKQDTFNSDPEQYVDTKLSGRYKIKHVISRGGMGIIYLAFDVIMGRDVALKIILPNLADNKEIVQRFIREVKLTSKLVHPNIIILHNFGRTERGVLFMVMEYIKGESLSALLKQEHALKPMETVQIAAQIASALEESHRKGIIHRDLKPSNVMLYSRGNMENFVKVLDFGIAKSLLQEEAEYTRKGLIIGTPAYMAPEQLLGKKINHRADIFSLGVLCCKMLTGKRPYNQVNITDLITLYRNNAKPEFQNKLITSQVSVVFDKALALKQENRYNNAKEFVKDLADSLKVEIKIPWF